MANKIDTPSQLRATRDCCRVGEFGVFVENGIIFCHVNVLTNDGTDPNALADEVVAALNTSEAVR